MSTVLINPFISFPAASGSGATDPDAAAYIAGVEAADGDVLEAGVVTAIDNLFIALKADGNFGALAAGQLVLLRGARTLAGLMVPAIGVAPTSVDFVDADVVRSSGLRNAPLGKILELNRQANSDPQNDRHFYVRLVVAATVFGASAQMGGSGLNAPDVSAGQTAINRRATNGQISIGASSGALVVSVATASPTPAGGWGVSRSSSTEVTELRASVASTVANTSGTPTSDPYTLFPPAGANYRFSAVSSGRGLNIELLNQRIAEYEAALNVTGI